MTDKHCESVNECANGELCAMLKNSVGLTLVGCSHFKPKQPMTNEEWFDGLSTEEKAKWLTKHSKFIYECGQKQVAPKIMYEEDWEYWLKETHE